MNNIIAFKKKGGFMKLEELLTDLSTKNKNEHEYSLVEIRKIANDILHMKKYYSGKCATPIIRIAKEFDFKT